MTAGPRMGFFTDTSVCIGCKACEVACKEWNMIPQDGPLSLSGNSYDNTLALGASTWRHVAFIEQQRDDQGLRWLGVFPRLARAAEAVAGLLGPALATYTGTLVADTAVPVWHEAGRELPFVFAGSAAGRARLAEREREQLQQ
jgi:formate dehydrogenase iron-sulfur subunit